MNLFLIFFFFNKKIVKEEKFLKQIALEEKYGGKTYQQQKAEDEKQKVSRLFISRVFYFHILISRDFYRPRKIRLPLDSLMKIQRIQSNHHLLYLLLIIKIQKKIPIFKMKRTLMMKTNLIWIP